MDELCANAYEYMHRESPSKSNTQQQKLIKSKKRSNIATFNVRGLSKPPEQHNLVKDMIKYKVDICCLQETKVSEQIDEIIDGYRLILLPGKCRHYGLGFAINQFWTKRLKSFEYFDDRIAVATFSTSKSTTMKIINIYAPTQMKAKENPSTRDNFYDQLENVLAKINRQTIVFIAGDFNSKIGSNQSETPCIGKYGRGRRNENGQHLVEFCESHELIATNTLFQHRASHRTTWSCMRKDTKTGQNVPIYNQIDYIFAHKNETALISNARSYSGTYTSSDHRIVITTTIITPKFKRQFGQNNTNNKPEKINLDRLVSDEQVRLEYQQELRDQLTTNPAQGSAIDRWTKVSNYIKKAAKNTAGLVPQKRQRMICPILEQLSAAQQELRIRIANTNEGPKKQELRKERNTILHAIHKRIKQNHESELERKTAEIESLNHGAQMFAAVKALTQTKSQALVINNDAGETITQADEAAERVAKYFAELFFIESMEAIESITSGPLHRPITISEITKATSSLKNGRAVGPDGIAGELLKYGDTVLHGEIAQILNQMFENGEELELGRGTLIVLQKPRKPLGQLSSLRPIVLLNTIRKTLSLVTLNRIRQAVESFLSPNQSGFRQNRSTADAVWAHKWMIATIMKIRIAIFILGIDMSRAFDTIDRAKLLREMKDIVDNDSWRMVQILLVSTTLEAKIRSALSNPFATNIGAPQGDSLSPVLFTIYLELALREIRAAQPRPLQDSTIPNEIEYADDTDFISRLEDVIDSIEIKAAEILKTWNLAMNSDKTEKLILRREQDKEEEVWRKSKKLGTLLGDTEELQRRKQLAAASFAKLKKIWREKNNKMSIPKRLRLYNAYVMPVLTYNASTWALSDTEVNEIDSFRRRQLRIVIGVRYPRKLSSKELYKRTNTVELKHVIRKARWSLLGHVLRMSNETPANFAMTQYFNPPPAERYLGRPRTTLPGVLSKDLELAKVQVDKPSLSLLPSELKTTRDLEKLRELAANRRTWRSIVANMYALEPPQPQLRPHRRAKQ